MLNSLNTTYNAYSEALQLKRVINLAGKNDPFFKDTRAAEFIQRKGLASPIFYTLGFQFTQKRLEQNLDLEALGKLSSAIILTDEVLEADDETQKLEDCLDASLDAVGLNSFREENPLSYSSLQEMRSAMLVERSLTGKRSDLTVPLLGQNTMLDLIATPDNPGSFFQHYLAWVSKAFGMKPLYALVAETHNEQASFQNTEEHRNLTALEAASRVLADVLTLGKDLKSGAHNVVTQLNQEMSLPGLKQGIELSKALAVDLLNQSRPNITAESPLHQQFALGFTEVLEAAAGVRDPQLTPSPFLEQGGRIISKIVFPCHLRN